MSKLSAFPKIFAVGTDYISDIFKEPVEITEKVDGSQFVFGKLGGELHMRSKGAEIYLDNPNKMFLPAVEYVKSIESLLPDNTALYCEFLGKPKHNVLTYERVPKNYLALFGIKIGESFVNDYHTLFGYGAELGLDVVPLLYRGMINSAEELFSMLEKTSFLGGPKIEGVVVKNYERPFLLGGHPLPLMAGKYVSEAFKEVHRKNWDKENTGRGRFEVYKTQFNTEARWLKAIQHLNDVGKLENSPRDIGNLLKEIQSDIIEEEKANILDFLWKEFSGEILRASVRGFPEWYKRYLAERSFSDE